MARFVIAQHFDAPVDAVFARFDTHEKLNRLFAPLQAERVRAGNHPSQPDGVGSVRRLGFGPVKPLAEEITAFEPGQRIEYRIVGNPLVRHHRGEMRFEPKNGGTEVQYTVELDFALPLVGGLLLAVLKKGLSDGLSRMAKQP